MSPAEPGHASGALKPGPEVREMFGRIVGRYDLMNRLMTGGRDVAWRNLAVRAALSGYPCGTARVVDVATGTGDLALALAAAGAAEVIGVDFAAPMLRAAAAKPVASEAGRLSWVVADAMALPFADGAFDACTVAFGLRNMPDYGLALAEVARVLRPGGRFVASVNHPLRWALPDSPDPDDLRVVGSYFDRTPYVETGAGDEVVYVEHHRTVGDWVRALVAAGLVVEDLLEPEWTPGRTETWGQWSPERGALVPGTLVLVCHRTP